MESTTIIGWHFDDTENADAWGHAQQALLGFDATLAIVWDQWRDWIGYIRGDGPDARKNAADAAYALRRLNRQNSDALDEIINRYSLLDGCDDYRGAAYWEEQSDRGADWFRDEVAREEQALIDAGEAHREPVASCGCIDWPCCGCSGYVLVGGAA